MQLILTPAQMQALDAQLIHTQHIPGLVLMEHAAMGVTAAVQKKAPRLVYVLCGGGNNGGDGLAVLRQLAMRGIAARGVLLVGIDALKADARAQYDMALGCALALEEALDIKSVEALELCKADVLVDALFGTGLSRPVQGHIYRLIERINAANKHVVAVDIPSGIDGNTGQVCGIAVRADETVTFQHKKRGHVLLPGRAYTGALTCVPIGVPQTVPPGAMEELEQADVAKLLPPRPIDSHKGSHGRALLIAGSEPYAGAAILSANAALRGGCGLLHLCVPKGIHAAALQCPAAICHPLGEGGKWDETAAQAAQALLPLADALAIGPGIGDGAGIARILERALDTKKPLVIDADGLNALAKSPALQAMLHERVILTPHPGEMHRLTGAPVEAIAAAPVEAALAFAKESGCIVLLKGASSIITDGERLSCNTAGNPGLAKGGSGDVLTGLLLALLAQKLPPYEAARVGAYLLGSSADEALLLLQNRLLLPTDVIGAITCNHPQ